MSHTSFGRKIVNAPYLVWTVIFIIVPIVMVARYAFTDKNGSFTLENIYELSRYKETFLISILYALIATFITLLISYPFAYIMSKSRLSTQKITMLLVMLPMWMNILIRTYSWMIILENNGIINGIIKNLGGSPVKLIGTPGAVILGMVYNYLPYMILPLYSVMSKIDNSLLQAAEDLGCNGLSKLKRIIFPLSLPGVVSGITMVFVPSISTFYISQKLGNGKILLIGDAIERQFNLYNYNLGASISFVLMLLILLSLFVMNRFTNEDDGGMIV